MIVMPHIFYTILFSLKEPKENPYILCAMIWLKSLFASGTVQLGDRVIIQTEAKTAEYLRTINIFRHHLVELRVCMPPRDALEGMNLKYLFRPEQDAVVVYSDVDEIFKKPFRPELPPDTLLVYPEGPPASDCYSGDYDLSGASAGYSAGLFAYRYGPRVHAFLDSVLERCKVSKKRFYALEQPHYNRALLTSPVNRVYLNPTVVSYNGHGASEQTVIYNLCGEPGDGPLHLLKMLDMWLMLR